MVKTALTCLLFRDHCCFFAPHQHGKKVRMAICHSGFQHRLIPFPSVCTQTKTMIFINLLPVA